MSSSAKKSGTTSKRAAKNNDGNRNKGDANGGNSDSEKNSGSSKGPGDADGDEHFGPGSWECTVCTFRNRYEAFKCSICDTRKGTSTRKPRLNPSVVQQQTLVQKLAVEVERAQQKKQRNSAELARNSPECFSPASTSSNPSQSGRVQPKSKSLMRRRPIPFPDALVVRSAAKKTVVTVNGLSFTVTEFKPRISPRGRKKLSATANNTNKSTNDGNSSTANE